MSEFSLCTPIGRISTVLTVGAVLAGYGLWRRSARAEPFRFGEPPRQANAPSPSPSVLPTFFEDQDGVTLDYNAPPFAPLKSCPIVFLYATAQGGLGHRMTGLAIALYFAHRARAAVVIDRDSMYNLGRSVGGGESYQFAEELFNLGRFASMTGVGSWETPATNLPWGVFLPGGIKSAFDIVAKAERGEACGQVFGMATGAGACDGDWCMSSDRLGGTYRIAHRVLAPLYAAGNYSRRPLTAYAAAHAARPRPLTVAWHVRNGDLKPHDNPGFFSALKGSLDKGLNGTPAAHFVFSEHPITPDSPWGFHWLPGFAGFTFTDLSGLSVEASEHHLIGADILVHYGASSFSYAATLAAPMSQVKLYVVPKEVSWLGKLGAYETHITNGSVPVDEASGAVLPRHEAELRDLIRARYRLVTGSGSG